MAYYTGDEQDEVHVTINFFKPSGKHYTEEAIVWPRAQYKGLIHDAFQEALKENLNKDGKFRLKGMIAVCVEPYHEHSHPIMVIVGHPEKPISEGNWDY